MKTETAERKNIGNMKGIAEEELSSGRIRMRAGNRLVYLSGAEMDLKTAPVIRKSLSAFAQSGLYGFTIQDHRYNQAVCWWMKKTRYLQLDEKEIVVTTGTISAVNTTIKAFTKAEDGVVLQAPSYYRFDRVIQNHNRKVVYNPMTYVNGNYGIDFENLQLCCKDPANKILLICNPHNPTGRVFTKQELQKMIDIARENQMIIFCDEIFGEMVSDKQSFCSALTVGEEGIIVSTSLGKSFNFTGVNQANLLIRDLDLRERFLEQQKKDHMGSIDPFFYNALCSAYTEEGYQWIQEVWKLVKNNEQRIREFCEKKMPLIKPVPLEGGFILWLDMGSMGMDDEALQDFMEQEANVVGDPGIEYGSLGKGFYRIQIAAPEEKICKMLEQMEKAYMRGWEGK